MFTEHLLCARDCSHEEGAVVRKTGAAPARGAHSPVHAGRRSDSGSSQWGWSRRPPPPRQITRAEGRQGQSARASEGDRDTGLGPESRDVSQLSGPPLPRVRLGDQACSSRRPWERSTKGGVGFKVGGTPSGGRARGLCQGGPGQPEGPCWRGTTIAKGQQDWQPGCTSLLVRTARTSRLSSCVLSVAPH